jgi:MinD superfamily P-loop ATPase
MIISVASGKGGTGKTTISTNLALSIDRRVKLLDCDVEEPNAHLFINPDIHTDETVYTMIPEIDQTLCNGCRKCAEICRFNALTVIGEKVIVFPELCHSCGGCVVVCPEHAVEEGARELGIIETGSRDRLTFIHGTMRVGEAMSPPLIRKVRSKIKEDDLVIIDAPPGTSCPVITAMKNTDFVLLVTEPTPFGLHDLKLAVEAVKVLGMPCGIVINRSDIGDHSVQEYAAQEDIPVLLEIPFDRRIAEIYSRGRLLIEEFPTWRQTFKMLYRDIVEIIESKQVIQ